MLQTIDNNFLLHASKVPGQAVGMKVHHSKNISYVDSGLSCDTFNVIHITNGMDVTREELLDALTYFREQGLQYCVWVSEKNLTAQLESIFKELSVLRQGEEIGMVLNLNQYDATDQSQNHNIEIADTAEKVMDYARVIASNWQPADQNVIRYFSATVSHYLAKDHIMLIIYYENGQPISTIEIFPSDEHTVGFYSLATLKEYRGRGIGSTMMTFALNKSKALGYRQVVLQASEDGVGIYRRLGFKDCTRYYEYV